LEAKSVSAKECWHRCCHRRLNLALALALALGAARGRRGPLQDTLLA